MEPNLVMSLAKKIGVSAVEIAREEIEVFLLDELAKTTFSQNLVFKGGTALRLFYGSPRFSQDLDFSVLGKVSFSSFKKLLNRIVRQRKELKIKDIYDKRETIFALIGVNLEFLKQSFSIKIEFSKKKYHLKKNDYFLRGISSPVSPLTPLVYVYSLERILYEKKLALKTRGAPRDYFDCWWIGEKLGKKIDFPKPKMKRSQFVGEINQLLPSYLKHWSGNFCKRYE